MNARADWRTTVATLAHGFASRAAQLDESDEFVAEARSIGFDARLETNS